MQIAPDDCDQPQEQPHEEYPAHQEDHQGRRDGVAEAGEGVGDALREAALARGRPVGHRARGGGEGRAFADAEQDPGEEERPEVPDHSDQDGCAGRELQHEGDPTPCLVWTPAGCNYCGVQF